MEILRVEALWPEKKGKIIHRDDIGDQYIFIHFITPVKAILRGEETEVKPGGCVIFGARRMQHFTADTCELLHDWFHADEDCGKLMTKYGLECERVYYPVDGNEITHIVNDIELEYTSRKPFFVETAEAKVNELFVALARSSGDWRSGEAEAAQRDRLKEARLKIHSDIKRRWTVEDMAKLVNLSPSRFYTVYKNAFGISPQNDLVRKRVQTAHTMLLGGSWSVEDVAEATGYTSVYHFIRQFRQITGVTPGKVKSVAKTQEI